MVESNSIEGKSLKASNVYPNDQPQFRPNEINEIKDYF